MPATPPSRRSSREAPEIFNLLPKESEHGKQFDEAGVREARYVSNQDVRAWQIYRADDAKEVERVVESFPLPEFCKVNPRAAGVTRRCPPPSASRKAGVPARFRPRRVVSTCRRASSKTQFASMNFAGLR
jgi:hypothetical protein